MKFYEKPLFLKIIFILSIAIILFISAVSFRNIKHLNESNDVVKHSYIVYGNLEKLYGDIKDLEIEGFNMARMISHSKSFYRKTFPYNQVYFNANIFYK